MNNMSEIALQAGKKVAEKIEAHFNSLKEQLHFEKKATLTDGSSLYVWSAMWVPYRYDSQQKLLDILASFKNAEDVESAYKLIIQDDEEGFEIRSNTPGEDEFTELYITNELKLPQTEEKKDLISRIEKALENTTVEETSEKMAGLLMDDSISTYKMFEDLSSRYLDGSTEFREGMDTALQIITLMSLAEIAECFG